MHYLNNALHLSLLLMFCLPYLRDSTGVLRAHWSTVPAAPPIRGVFSCAGSLAGALKLNQRILNLEFFELNAPQVTDPEPEPEP